MGARNNFVLAAESTSADWWAVVLNKIEPLFRRRVGIPHRLMFHDHGTNRVREMLLPDAPLNIQHVTSQEIVTIYPADATAGCMQLAAEGHFQTVTLSVLPKLDLHDILKEAWIACGEVVDIILAGEELEVDEASLDDALNHSCISENLDQCDALIVRPRTSDHGSFKGTMVEHGGVLIIARDGVT